MKVLFVCLGNICRSPTAEAVMQHVIRERGLPVETDSAGTAAWHVGKSPDSRSMAAAKRRGIDMSHLRARQVVEQDFHEFDFILAMDAQNYRDLKAVQPESGRAKLSLFLHEYGDGQADEVPDPYYGGEDGFELVLDLLQTACDIFVAQEVVK